uniref:Uncharacterized protein n=1 Tax=Gouania willdenowi TaxID=441366 RepID=A0A8C5N3F3_GOUWI
YDKYLPQYSTNDNCKQTCESPITVEELDTVIGRLLMNKAPGSEGLTGNFYRYCKKGVGTYKLLAATEIFETCLLPPTMRQGIIMSIPNPNKDLRFIENRKPITLRNSDYKLQTCIFSTRLQTGISNLVSETQSVFLKADQSTIDDAASIYMDI